MTVSPPKKRSANFGNSRATLDRLRPSDAPSDVTRDPPSRPLTNLQRTELGLDHVGHIDPRRPQGMSQIFEEAVTSESPKSSDMILKSLLWTQAYLNDTQSDMRAELRDTAAPLIADEIHRTRIVITNAASLLEV